MRINELKNNIDSIRGTLCRKVDLVFLAVLNTGDLIKKVYLFLQLVNSELNTNRLLPNENI